MAAYEQGTVIVPAVNRNGSPLGMIPVRWELVGFTECPGCGFDTLAHVIIHGPVEDIMWSSCDRCTHAHNGGRVDG